jgi:hypothetical protein
MSRHQDWPLDEALKEKLLASDPISPALASVRAGGAQSR